MDDWVKALSRRELRASEIIGWRCWWVNGNILRLHSLFAPDNPIWHPGTPMLGDPDSAMPDTYGARRLGVYAIKAQRDSLLLQRVISQSLSQSAPWNIGYYDALAVGTVRLYGRVDEHEHGYRAEAAMVESIDRFAKLYPRAIKRLVDEGALLVALRAAYGVEAPRAVVDAAQWTGRN